MQGKVLQDFTRQRVSVELGDVSLVLHHIPVGVVPVGDGDDSALRELLPDGGLHHVVSFKVHGRVCIN